MEDNMSVISDSKNFELPQNGARNLKHEIQFIIKRN